MFSTILLLHIFAEINNVWEGKVYDENDNVEHKTQVHKRPVTLYYQSALTHVMNCSTLWHGRPVIRV